MTMTFNGSGTITGLTPGGLPNQTVTTATLADSSVTPVKTQIGALPSMVRLNTTNGSGSVNTFIRRFTNVVTNQGSDITYADSATLGASFTINTNGVYAIHYGEIFNGAGYFGISLNSVTGVGTDTAANILSLAECNTNYPGVASWTGYLPAGSIVRPNSNANNTVGSPATAVQFTITRIA